MLKRLLTLSSLFLFAPAALANVQISPQSNQEVGSYQTLNQQAQDLSVSLRYVSQPELARVYHPNAKGKLSDDFSPYAYRNIVDTQVFQLTIRNLEGRVVNADQVRLSVSLNGLPYEYYDQNNLIKQWRHYYYLNTNTITGAPDFMEQERAIIAEKHIAKHSFRPKDIPPGGEITGLIAIPSIQDSGTLKMRVRNLGQRNAEDFVFRFDVQKLQS